MTRNLLEDEPGAVLEPELIGNLKTDVFFLPEWYSNSQHARRSDVGVPRIKLGQVNGSTDLRAAVDKFAQQSGAYFAESRAGRDVLDSQVFHLQPTGQNINADSPQVPTPRHAHEQGRRYGRRERYERAAYRPPRRPYRSMPRAVESPLSSLELLQQIQQQVNAQRAQERELEERVEARVRASIPVAQVERIDRVDAPFENTPHNLALQLALELARGGDHGGAVAVLGAGDEGEPRGAFAQIADMALKNPAAAQQMFGGLLGYLSPVISMLGSGGVPATIPGASTQPPATPAPPAANAAAPAPPAANAAAPAPPQSEGEAFQLILHVAVADMIRNKRVGRTADLIEEMCRRFPTLNATVDQLCALSPESALLALEHHAGRNDLAALGHGLDWVANLMDELRPGDDEGEASADATNTDAAPNIVGLASARVS